MYKSIAIDGPSGAGKSTLARRAAQALGYLYVDTGAIYRTLGLYVLRHGADPSDPEQVVGLLRHAEVELKHGKDGLQHMYLAGEDVSEEIRQPRVSKASSVVSAYPQVRNFLLNMQRDLARRSNVIMDGRDIGTVVLPQADVKIFLTASTEARATRRHRELLARGLETEYGTVLKDIIQRDHDDTTRSAAPLRQAEDALLVDTTALSFEDSVRLLLDTIERKLNP